MEWELETKTETPFGKELKICQGRNGYRFSIDTPILAYHVSLESGEVGVDLGTGCGVMLLFLAKRFPRALLYGIEIQDELARLASRNIRVNDMSDHVRIIHGDMKDSKKLIGSGMADVVFSNPPYRPVGSGRLSPNRQRAVAKHEIRATLSDVVSTARILLKTSGCFWVIYPAGRLVDLLTQMRAYGLEPKQLRLIHSNAGSEAERVLVGAVKGGNPGLAVLPPVITHNRDGSFTEEMARMLTPSGG